MYEKWKQYQNYAIIAIASLFALFFIPMLGTEIGLAWVLPTTTAGWMVYIITKLLVAGLNVLIFHCFVQQAKINSLNHPNYLLAQEILGNIKADEAEKALSPKEYFSGVYGRKMVLVFLSSAVSAIGLTQAILTFDLVSMLTYLFTIVVGIIAGLLEMAKDEIYWQESYLKYAKEKQREAAENAAKVELEVDKTPSPHEVNDTPDNSGGAPILESVDSLRTLGSYR